MKRTTTVIIGAGQSGLAMSFELAHAGTDHIVLERGQIANSWRKERWDSLRLLTPNWMNGLAGADYSGTDHDGFMNVAELVHNFDRAVIQNNTPVQTETTVLSVRPHGAGYRVQTDQGEIACQNVVMANGACAVPKVPAIAADVPAHIAQTTPHDYKRPSDLPDGGVLVVGASASGLQLAQEINRAGRDVTLAVGNHLRLPRSYRAWDIVGWMDLIGAFGTPYTDVDDIDRVRRTPSLSLIGTNAGDTIDLNTLQAEGVKIAGRLAAVRDGKALFSGGLNNMCAAADLKLNRMLQSIDDWVSASGLEPFIAASERFAPTHVPQNPKLSMCLGKDVRSIVWATGYAPDFSWLDMPVFGRKGQLIHDGGIVAPGLYAMGLPYLRRRSSTHIHGAQEDARALANHLNSQLHQPIAA
jgi:putative flavoprotein involved in K+ transport